MGKRIIDWHQEACQVTAKGDLAELRLSGNHTVTEYEMSGEPYSQKKG